MTPGAASGDNVWESTNIVEVPSLGPVFQITPGNESDTYTLPALSKVSALRPELDTYPVLMNTVVLPLFGLACQRMPLERSQISNVCEDFSNTRPSGRVLGWGAPD
jgi:hypothetical protein